MMTETRDIVNDFSYGWCSLVQVGADWCISRQTAEREMADSYPDQTKTQCDLYVLPLANFGKVKLVWLGQFGLIWFSLV